ncbi:Os09g0382000, partial [Oryza sativa Japonica Group]
ICTQSAAFSLLVQPNRSLTTQILVQHDAVRKEQRLNYSKSTQVQNWSSSASLLGRTKMVKWALGFQAWAPWKSGAQTKVGDRFSFLPRTRGEVARGIGAKGSFPVSPFPPYFSLVCFRFNRERKNPRFPRG